MRKKRNNGRTKSSKQTTYVFFRRGGKVSENDKILFSVLRARGVKVVVRDICPKKRMSKKDKFKTVWFDEIGKFEEGSAK